MGQVTEGYQIMNAIVSAVTTDIRPDNNFDQPGVIWTDLDPVLGWREFVWFGNTGTNTAATVIGQTIYWADNYKLTGSNSLTDSTRDCVLGVAVSVVPKGSYGWAQIKGYHAHVLTYDGTYAQGQRIMSSSYAGLGIVCGALGTAPTYTILGTALGAATNISANLYYVPAQLNVGGF